LLASVVLNWRDTWTGKVELRGGSVEDQREAREWIAKFMPRVAAALPEPDRRNK
jgi:hypothetical protein